MASHALSSGGSGSGSAAAAAVQPKQALRRVDEDGSEGSGSAGTWVLFALEGGGREWRHFGDEVRG